jgi:hypothetical protein
MCAEPVRHGRGGSRSARGAGLSPVLRWVLGGALVVVLGMAGCCALGMWGMGRAVKDAQQQMEQARADAEANRRARTVAVPAAQLLQEFQADPAAADQKYRGKYLEVSGVVERVGRNRDQTPFVILHAGDETARIKVECFFDPADDEDETRVERLGKGQAVTVRGEFGGRVSNVQLRECVLVK